jgi:polyhydroxybutyrate depolymerase
MRSTIWWPLLATLGFTLACMTSPPTGGAGAQVPPPSQPPEEVRERGPADDGPQAQRGPKVLDWRDVVDGEERQAKVSLPPNYDGKTSLPVVLALHGGGGTIETMMSQNGWKRSLDERGWIGIYPQTGKKGKSSRGDGGGDVDYYKFLLKKALDELAVDTDRVYVVGFSAGGRGTYLLMNQFGKHVTAFAAHSSSIMKGDDPPEWTDPVHNKVGPISMLHIHGKRDTRIPWDGGRVERDDGSSDDSVPATDGAKRWAKALGATMEPGGSKALPGRPQRLRSQRWVTPSGHVVQLVLDPQLPHEWARMYANDLILDFFESVPTKSAR